MKTKLLIPLGIIVDMWLLVYGFTSVGYQLAPKLQAAAAQPAAIQAQVVLTPLKDNTLYESVTGGNSSGAGAALFVGKTKDGARRRGLLAFDLAGQLPPGATIISVTLRLNMLRTQGGTHTVALHKITTHWGEGTSNAGITKGGAGVSATTNDATWIHSFFNTQPWQQPGGDFSATASATASVGGNGSYTWGSTPGLIADVQSWLSNPASNFGWILIGNEAANQTAKAFGSKEQSTAGTRPQLTIVYQTVADTPTATATPSATPSPTGSATPTFTPTSTPSATPSLTPTSQVSPTGSATPTPTGSPTLTPNPTGSVTPVATGSPTLAAGRVYLPQVGSASTPTPTRSAQRQNTSRP